ncbi:uncharacterized protein si:ch211-14c7.2 [Synchiropus splendidus]|uniref:uncharacterized protein si:ch211-14c7.2 n=1 Tax=Synchiropus splendidus TaxID=270530 RepID=UPI00237D9B78|nr:uncharacterized protein si:ch211-14c7.2 [Synchiropus splendidus]XP_053728944.1 uncharacterized protein si:ch211-14c7.2 [Synchiropus splendidus]
MRPRTSSMLQQNNNNNYPCLGMSGSTREMLQKCSRVALPFPGRLELGDLPLIRGLRAWALCSKNRRKPVGGSQAPLEPPPQRSSLCCPRPADVYLSGEWGSMGYGLPLGMDARQSGIGALVTVATLKTSEGNGKTQTQCLFLRTEKGSCLYSTAKPGSGGTTSAVGGWLRGKTGGGKEAGRRDPGVQVQTGANRVRVRSGRRWRKPCNTAGREKAGLSKERRRSEGGRQEEQDKGRREQEGASPPSGNEAVSENGSQRSRDEDQSEGTLSCVGLTEDFSLCSSSRFLSPDHDVETQQCHHEEDQKTQTVDPNSDMMKSPAEDVITPQKLLKVPLEDNHEPGEQQSEDTPADGFGVSVSFSNVVTSGESRTFNGLKEVGRVEEQRSRCLPLSNCDSDHVSQTEDDEARNHLMCPSTVCDVQNGPEPKEKLDQCGSSRTGLRKGVGSSSWETQTNLKDESQGSGLHISNLDLHQCPADVNVDPGITESRAGDLNIPLDLMPKKELQDHCQVSSPPAGGSTCLLESDTNLWIQEGDGLQQEAVDLYEEKKSEFLLQDEEQRRRGLEAQDQKIVRDCGEREGGGAELLDDGDETCQLEEQEGDEEVQRSEEAERSSGERETLLSKEGATNVADLLHSLTLANPAPPGVMATGPPRLEEERRGVRRTGQGVRDGSKTECRELENSEETPGEEEERRDEGEDDFGVFMQAEGELAWSHPETDPVPQLGGGSSAWTPDWTQSASLTDDSWTAFPPTAEGSGEASGPWWPAVEERRGRSHNLASLFTQAFPPPPSRGSPSELDPVPTLTQILQCGAGQHKRLLDGFHDLNKMIVERNKRASGASRELLLRTLRLERPRQDSRPAPWPANRRPSPGLSSASRHSQIVAAKRRLSCDYNRNCAE